MDLSFLSDNKDASSNLDSKSIVSFLDQQRKYCEAARKPFEAGVFTSIMFLGGNQYMSAIRDDISNAIRRKVDAPPVSCGTVRIVNNIILPCYRQGRSIMYDMIPEFSAVPAAPGSPQDAQAAKIASSFIEWREVEDKEDKIRRSEINWLLATGEINRRGGWNAQGGREGYNEGDINTEFVNWFRQLKDPQCTDSQWPPRYWIEFDSVHVDKIKQDFGIVVEPENIADMSAKLDQIATNVIDSHNKQRESPKNSVLLYRMYVRKCAQYPQGHVFVWANDKLLREHDLIGGVWPIERGEWLPIPGRLYSMGLIESLIRPQKRLNYLESQLANVTNKKIRGDIVKTGVGDIKRTPGKDGEGQQIIQLGVGVDTKFEFAKYDIDMNTAYEERERTEEAIRRQAGTNESTLGALSSKGDVKVTELMLARESDTINFTYFGNTLAQDYWCPILEGKVALASQFYQNMRVMDTANSSNNGVYEFRGTDLGNTKKVIFKVNPHVTPAMLSGATSEAADAGLLGDWPTPARYVASLMVLRSKGLKDKAEELESKYGSEEEMTALAVAMQQKQYDIANMQIELNARTLANQLAAPPPMVDPATGQPIPPQGQMVQPANNPG